MMKNEPVLRYSIILITYSKLFNIFKCWWANIRVGLYQF